VVGFLSARGICFAGSRDDNFPSERSLLIETHNIHIANRLAAEEGFEPSGRKVPLYPSGLSTRFEIIRDVPRLEVLPGDLTRSRASGARTIGSTLKHWVIQLKASATRTLERPGHVIRSPFAVPKSPHCGRALLRRMEILLNDEEGDFRRAIRYVNANLKKKDCPCSAGHSYAPRLAARRALRSERGIWEAQ